MDFSEVTSGTPKVLDHCLSLFAKPTAENEPLRLSKSVSGTPAKYASHPDIQFFSSVKAKNHFAYHQSKKAAVTDHATGTAPAKKATNFDPFSRPLLLARLRSYSALNWVMPYFGEDEPPLTELFCSSHGWKCDPLSRSNNAASCLKCTGCDRQLILRFNSLHEQPEYAPFPFEMDDIQELNVKLKDQYMKQIRLSAHAASCPWRNFACPVNGTYYLIPHVSTTNATLISDYVSLLHKLYTNLALADHYKHTLSALAPPEIVSNLDSFIKVSNSWLLSKYFSASKENFAPLLEKTFPTWAYVLAAMGWDLSIQTFGAISVPLLVCTMCNQRVFLEPTSPKENSQKLLENVQGATSQESGSLHLTKHSSGPNLTPKSASPEYMDCEPEDNALACHKAWCLLVSQFGGTSFFSYFHETLINSEKNIGPGGKYQNSADEFTDMDVNTESQKRRRSFDVTSNLERFSKLRKLYFADTDP